MGKITNIEELVSALSEENLKFKFSKNNLSVNGYNLSLENLPQYYIIQHEAVIYSTLSEQNACLKFYNLIKE